MYFHWNTFAIVMNTDVAFVRIDLNFEEIHLSVSLEVVRCIYEHLVEYLVKSWDKCDFFIAEPDPFFTQDPLAGGLHFNASHVGVRAQKDMLERSLLLVRLLDGFLAHSSQ
jgi:hypothetical protein